MVTWLKGCEICNVGLINKLDEIVTDKKISVKKASELLAKEGERKIGKMVYTSEAIRSRYRLHKGKREPNPKNKAGHNDQPSTTIPKKNQSLTPTQKSKPILVEINPETKEVMPIKIDQKQVKQSSKKEVMPTETDKKQVKQTPKKEATPTTNDLSARFLLETSKASAQAKQPKKSELEKAATIIKSASNVLDKIVEGEIKDNGTAEDKLFSESIKRHGPRIIINLYRIGIDPEKAVNYYKGGSKNGETSIIERNLRIT